MELLLLHHTGIVTGRRRVTPVARTAVGDDFVVVGSNGGAASDPAWATDLAAMTETTIEVGDRKLKAAVSEVVEPVERERLHAEVKKAYPGVLEGYESKTDRTFKVVKLTPFG